MPWSTIRELNGSGGGSRLDENVRADVLKITAGLCTVCIWLFFGARVVIRWPLRKLVGKDDYLATAATIVSLAQMIVLMFAINAGLGSKPNTLPLSSTVTAAKLVFASDLIYVLTIYIAKLAVASFFLRLASSQVEYMLAIALLVAGALLAVVSLVVVGATQHADSAWIIPGPATGHNLFYRWIAVEVMSNVYELALLSYPIFLVAGLRMQLNVKSKVVVAFVLRTPVIPLSILRLVSLSRSLVSTNFLYDYAKTQVWTQAEMCFTVISATIICLRIFLMAARSGIQGVPEYIDPMDSQAAVQGSYGSRSWRSNCSKSAIRHMELDCALTPPYGETITSARGDRPSVVSTTSETAIMVRQTVDVYSQDDADSLRNPSV